MARRVGRRWRWHIGDDRTESFGSLSDALDALREAAPHTARLFVKPIDVLDRVGKR